MRPFLSRILERSRWWLCGHVSSLPQVCPANAHGVLIWRTRNDPRIDGACRRDCANNGACWCGKLREPENGQ